VAPTDADVIYEYGIQQLKRPEEPHRAGMTRDEAEGWLADWLNDGGKQDVFRVIRRTLGPWEIHEPADARTG
jgi:hypothetical protein